MYIAMVDSPASDELISLGKSKREAIQGLINAYKEFYSMDEESLKEERDYDDFETYLDEYLGMNTYKISQGEAIVCGYDVHYKNGKRVDK